MRCEIVTQDRQLFEGEVDMVVAPGTEGVMGILPNHAPLVIAEAELARVLDILEARIAERGRPSSHGGGLGHGNVRSPRGVLKDGVVFRVESVVAETGAEGVDSLPTASRAVTE